MRKLTASWMQEEHALFADTAARFFEEECVPHEAQWEKDGQVDPALWQKAGALGLLGSGIDEAYGGFGGDYGFDAVIAYQQSYSNTMGWGVLLQSIMKHYVAACGTEEQRQRWLPGLISGEIIPAIAMTEPGTGSDLQAVKTRAIKDGNEYVINGSKIFITNGQQANFVVVVAKTDTESKASGISLIVVETEDLEGFSRGRNLDKMGMKAQDTSELLFEDVRVPLTNVLGMEEGKGFYQLMAQLPFERLAIGYWALGAIDRAIDETLDYVKGRKAFGNRLMDLQNTRFKLAECQTNAASFWSIVLSAFWTSSSSIHASFRCSFLGFTSVIYLSFQKLVIKGGIGIANICVSCRLITHVSAPLKTQVSFLKGTSMSSS